MNQLNKTFKVDLFFSTTLKVVAKNKEEAVQKARELNDFMSLDFERFNVEESN